MRRLRRLSREPSPSFRAPSGCVSPSGCDSASTGRTPSGPGYSHRLEPRAEVAGEHRRPTFRAALVYANSLRRLPLRGHSGTLAHLSVLFPEPFALGSRGMTEPSSKTPAYAYELPLEPDRPAVKKNALEMVIRTEP